MAFDNTITEQDIDLGTKQFVQGLCGEGNDYEPDLDVDGLSGGIVARILGLFGVGRS